ncbi:Uncharacterised protein [uncultured archaeon]|nr:Uncharacterised protein [uncultured archaeon]
MATAPDKEEDKTLNETNPEESEVKVSLKAPLI